MDKSLPNRAIEWRNQKLILLDQRLLPGAVEFIEVSTVDDAFMCIKEMVVRGAPAIGITAAYAVVVSALANKSLDYQKARDAIEGDMDKLAQARPTAVNLRWALARMRQCLHGHSGDWQSALEKEAIQIHEQDIHANHLMAKFGAEYLPVNSSVMTHCNAGALATGGHGTALGVIREAHAQGKLKNVFANETRPWFQGSRLTAWELLQDNIPVNLVCDSAAASAVREHDIDWIIVGADRVAANGDVANKIGTFSLAVLARHLGKKFMVVAPASTIDLQSASGTDIKIEVRDDKELTYMGQKPLAADGVSAWNPVFDITPAHLVDVIVTERGVIENPNREKIKSLFA